LAEASRLPLRANSGQRRPSPAIKLVKAVGEQMSKTKLTAQELYSKIINEVGDPGGLGISVHRSNDGGWVAEVRRGNTPLIGSGFQAAVDKIVVRLREQYDLCPYSAIPPMRAEGGRHHGRTQKPGPVREKIMRYWKDKGVTAVDPIFQIDADFFKLAADVENEKP
jgi:hypothetical protein